MRVAVVSDIHGNMTAFEAVLADLKSVGADLVVHGGDLVASGSRPGEVVDMIRNLGWPGVCGNTDEMLWRPELLQELMLKAPSRRGLRQVLFNHIAPATRELIGETRLGWLRSLPAKWSSEGITVLHASPGDLWRAPLANATDDELLVTYGNLQAATVIYGHIHHPFVRRLPTLTVANSGSVSLSYDGDPRTSYILWEDGNVSVRRVEYEVEKEVQGLEALPYPCADWLTAILRNARYVPPFAT